MSGADGFANADFACAFGDSDQHDVHDADAADQQCNEGDDEQHYREGYGNILCGIQDGGQRLHIVLGFDGMAALQEARHLTLHGFHVLRADSLRIEDAQDIHAGIVFHQRVRNNYGLFLDFGQAESSHALTKHADDGESELAHADRAAYGVLEAEDAIGKLFRHQANFAAGFHVRGIKIAAANDQEAAYGLEAFGDTNQIYRASGAGDDDGHRKFARARNFQHSGNGSLYRF